jgi:hypothetical protein
MLICAIGTQDVLLLDDDAIQQIMFSMNRRLNIMRVYLRFRSTEDLPEAVKRKLGTGRFKAKVLQRTEGELIAKATRDIGGIVIRLMYIR